MGRTYSFECPKCEYRVQVAGGADEGAHFAVQTIACADCRELYDVVIPARTLKHRRSRKEALSRDESDKLARLIRIYDQAVRVLGDKEKALHWLRKPLRRFAGRSPLQMLPTEFGARMVEEMLGQLDYGMFA